LWNRRSLEQAALCGCLGFVGVKNITLISPACSEGVRRYGFTDPGGMLPPQLAGCGKVHLRHIVSTRDVKTHREIFVA